MPPALSIVIPVFNEPKWIGPVVDDLAESVRRAGLGEVELIVVDDGSAAETQAALAALSPPFPHRAIRQENQGRFIARRTGIEAARHELVLLLDSRVSIGPDSLAFVVDQIERTGPLPIWTAHVEYDHGENLFGRIWCVLEYLAWKDYLGDPRTLSYGIDEYDRYPKGTTCFIAPREALRTAIASFTTLYDDLREANDDTTLIRSMVAHQPINISPGFSCTYRPRTTARAFLKHAFHRGSVFVDGYGRPGSRFFAVIAAFYPLSVAAALIGVRRPTLSLLAAGATPAAGAAAALAMRRPRADVAALAITGPMWLAAFAGGMWRGLWKLLRAAWPAPAGR